MEQYCDDDLLVEAQSDLWSHVFVFLKSMSLKCAVDLGIPDAIHRHGGPVSVPDLVAALDLPPARLPSLRRLMRTLSFSRLFTRKTSEGSGEDFYGLTPTSRLLVDDAGDRRRSLAPLVHSILDPVLMAPSLRVADWFKAADGVATPFELVHGSDMWDVTSRNPEFNAMFNEAMATDSGFVMDVVVRKCGHVFRGLRSLVDVGGGTGAAARAVAEAFPHVKCAVLELPHVVEGLPTDGPVEFFAGSMFERVPPADAVLLKMAQPGRGDGEERRGTGRGVGRPRRVPREPESSDRMQQLEDRLTALAGLQDQFTALAGLVQQFIQQQAAAPAAPAPPAPQPTVEPEGRMDPPVVPVPPPAMPAPSTASTSGTVPGVAIGGDPPVDAVGISPLPAVDANQAENARMKNVLMEFKKFKPRVFDGKNVDHWAVEQWIDHMEKLFRDFFTEERDKVHIAAHCLEDGASKWWDRHLQSHYEGLPKPSWRQFKEALYHRYLKETTKESLERELETIRQGDRSVREYEQEFSRIADLVPGMVREERRKVRLFSQGLRHEIRRQLSSHLIVDFDNCVERCLSIEADVLRSRAERDTAERNRGRKRPFLSDGGGSLNSGKPPRHPRNQDYVASTQSGSQQRGPRPCVFCGGPHRAITCDQRHGRCYRCGQAGHIVANCPERPAPAQSSASVPAFSSSRQSPAPSTSSFGRSQPPRQPDGTRQSAGGRVYVMTAPDAPPEDFPAGSSSQPPAREPSGGHLDRLP